VSVRLSTVQRNVRVLLEYNPETPDVGDVDHNHHNWCPPEELFLLMAIATAEASTPNFLAISAIEIPISGFKKQAISALTFDSLRL